jgi:hypothetical protein
MSKVPLQASQARTNQPGDDAGGTALYLAECILEYIIGTQQDPGRLKPPWENCIAGLRVPEGCVLVSEVPLHT